MSKASLKSGRNEIPDLPAADDGDAKAQLRRTQADLLAFCDMLETIADSLPANLDLRRCTIAAETVESLLQEANRFEERVIFPRARRELIRLGGSTECIDRLESEHCEDEGFAGELAGMLASLVAGDEAVAAETAGYMLRGFFVSLRRHVAFERDFLMSLL